VFGTVATAAVSVVTSVMAFAPATMPGGDTPPTTPPEPGAEIPERRLAEFSFAMYITLEFAVDPGEFTCSEPQGVGNDNTITCFALIDGTRVIVATAVTSDGTGVYDWSVISDHMIGSEAPTTTSPPPPTSAPNAGTNLSDAAILSFGEELNRGAEAFKDDVLRFTEGTITNVTNYGWDAATATLTLDVTLDPAQNFADEAVDRAAWILVQFLKTHWGRGEPFRLDGATLRPRLVLAVNSTQYVSDFDLMVRVADQLITNTDWVDASRQT